MSLAIFLKRKTHFLEALAVQREPGRIHHPKRAARLGTPVRSRFCSDWWQTGSYLVVYETRKTAQLIEFFFLLRKGIP
jgi:hypothetical protein